MILIDRPGEAPLELAEPRHRDLPEKVILGLRPEDIGEPGQRHGALVQTGACRVDVVEPAGADTYVVTRLGGAGVTARLSAETGARPGAPLTFAFDLAKASYFNPESGARIG
jgi:multiple sugar transport system ATP-binding protein